jgi:hypothetical protein
MLGLRTSNHAAAAAPTASKTIGSAPEINDSCLGLCTTALLFDRLRAARCHWAPPRLQQSGRCGDLLG